MNLVHFSLSEANKICATREETMELPILRKMPFFLPIIIRKVLKIIVFYGFEIGLDRLFTD